MPPCQTISPFAKLVLAGLFTVITKLSVTEQPFDVTVMVYVVVAIGVATGLVMLLALKEPDGAQE